MFTRLFDQFKPENYKLDLKLSDSKDIFSGYVQITGTLLNNSKEIKLHSSDLNIIHAKINGKSLDIKYGEYDVLTLSSADILKAGIHKISVYFEGSVRTDSMVGLYESKFTHNGDVKRILVTQFESHHAREVFPCVDEPEAKATFDLVVTTESDYPVLSNTSVLKKQKNKNLVVTQFETTPIMSTYLLALAYGDIHYVQAVTKDGVIVRTYSSVTQPKSNLLYSVNQAKRILDFFTNYFNTPFPLKKLDQIALPDFDAGAMENWGLITYREIALLNDSKNPSLETKQYISLVIAHELSHQWFGNLVTMKWWDDLWLNESFASIMEHLALNSLEPDWHQWEEYTATDIITTSSRDIFSDVQAVSVKVDNPELIETLFDPAIVYAKGGRLIKMLIDYIGEKDFQKGLSLYFSKYAYTNTTRSDLWQCLSEASNKNVQSLMDSWLVQSGMPIVKVDQRQTQLSLSQSRFTLDKTSDNPIWSIPLLANEGLTKDLLDKKTQTFNLKDDEYVFLNKNGSGHYITQYINSAHHLAIADKLKTNQISAEGRINFFNDQLLLSKRGEISLAEVLDLVVSNTNEKRDSVWNTMGIIVSSARFNIEGNKQLELDLKEIFARLILPIYKQLGWQENKNEQTNTTHLRVTAISHQLAGQNSNAINRALNLYEEHKTDISLLPANLRVIILINAVLRHKDHTTVIKNLLNQYRDTVSADLQLDITRALTATENVSDLDLYAKDAFGESGFVRQQDFIHWVALLASNQYLRQKLWDYVESNWEYVKKQLKGSKSYDYFPIYMGRGINTLKQQKRYAEFFKPKLKDKLLERNIKVALSDIASKVSWRQRDEDKIITWINKNTR